MRAAALALATAAALGWPLVAPKYLVFLGTLVAINAVVAIGLNLLSGYTNQLSFGHAGFLAIGAYVAALVTIHLPAPVPSTRGSLPGHGHPRLRLRSDRSDHEP